MITLSSGYAFKAYTTGAQADMTRIIAIPVAMNMLTTHFLLQMDLLDSPKTLDGPVSGNSQPAMNGGMMETAAHRGVLIKNLPKMKAIFLDEKVIILSNPG